MAESSTFQVVRQVYSQTEKKISEEVLDVIRTAKKVIVLIPADASITVPKNEMIRLCKATVASYKEFDLAMQNGKERNVLY
jgi:hypothetical protein